MISKRTLWFGFAIAPLSAPLAYCLWALFFFTDTTPKQEVTFELWLIFVALFFIPASYVSSLVIGIPLITVLRWSGKLSFWWVTLPATLLGAFVLTIFFFLLLYMGATIKGNIWLEAMRFTGIGGVLGFNVAIAFCFLVGISFRKQNQVKT